MYKQEQEEIEAIELTQDPIVNSVIRKFKQRSDKGMQTYGTTMADNTSDIFAWITHSQEELMDAILYLERMKQEIYVVD